MIEKCVVAEDVELHVRIDGHGPSLMFVAGLGGRGNFWDRQIAEFAGDYQVITFDQRGCGASTKNAMTESTAQIAEDVIAIMDHVGIASAHCIGHSTGGAVLQHVALNNPDRIDKLVLSNSWAGPTSYLAEYFSIRKQVLTGCGIDTYLKSGLLSALSIEVLHSRMDELLDQLPARRESFPGVDVEMSRIDAIMAHDLRSKMGSIQSPTLCIGAVDDRVIPCAMSEELAELLPDSRLLRLENGGHLSPVVRDSEFNRAVLRFLR